MTLAETAAETAIAAIYFSCGEKKNRKKSTRKNTVQSIQVNSCKCVETFNGTRNRCENLRAIVPPRAAERDEEDDDTYFTGRIEKNPITLLLMLYQRRELLGHPCV